MPKPILRRRPSRPAKAPHWEALLSCQLLLDISPSRVDTELGVSGLGPFSLDDMGHGAHSCTTSRCIGGRSSQWTPVLGHHLGAHSGASTPPVPLSAFGSRRVDLRTASAAELEGGCRPLPEVDSGLLPEGPRANLPGASLQVRIGLGEVN